LYKTKFTVCSSPRFPSITLHHYKFVFSKKLFYIWLGFFQKKTKNESLVAKQTLNSYFNTLIETKANEKLDG